MIGSLAASSAEAAPERNSLLATKLNVPGVRPDRLARSRLIEALNVAIAHKLVLVCTPAGFGKTTLLADWATAVRWPVAWLSLDADDNDPARFWRYVIASLDRACGGLADQLLPMLTGRGAQSSRGVVTALLNEIEARADDVVLVLDDYHAMASPLIHDELTFMLSRIPRQLHVAVASRIDPPLPLARFRAQDRLAELRATDLRFTSAESAEFLRRVWQLDLPADVIAALDAKTEGWAAGLQLAALSLRQRSDPDAVLSAFTGSHHYVLDYLTEEVLERQPDHVRTFLLYSSILDRMTGPLCDAITGGDDGQVILEVLERDNLFVVRLDEQRRWYRYHHLFAEALRARLRRIDTASLAELHRRAAGWCERHCLTDDAIRHAVAAEDPVWAARLVEQHLNETLQRGESALLARWIALLPDDARRARPGLWLAQGMQDLHAGRLDAVEQRLEHADRAFGEERSQQQLQLPTDGGMVAQLPAAVQVLRAELATLRGDAAGMASFASSALAHMSDHERGPRVWARLLLGSADWMRGRLAEAEAAFADVLAEARTTPVAYPMMATCFPLGRVRHARGKLEAALRTYENGMRFATECGTPPNPYHAAEAHLGMGQVLYERDELDRALHHVTAGIELGRHVVDVTSPLLGFLTLAWIRQASGDPNGARAAMDEACRLRPSRNVVSMWNPAPAERARLLVLQGRIEEARLWTEEHRLAPDDDLTYARERDYLVLARVLLGTGQPEQAVRLLGRLDHLAESAGWLQSLIQIRTVQALALQAQGDTPAALTVLADALALARPAGFIRLFADEGAKVAALLRSLISPRPGATAPKQWRQQVGRILLAFGSETPTLRQPAPRAGLVEQLTAREHEVLQLIAKGRHNREIAQDLVVTLDTVKKHASHILNKIGATSRTQAVARARELGLIP